MRVGVTGASGFVGRYIVDALTRNGHTVVGFGRQSREEHDWVTGDIRSPGDIHRLAERVDALVHAAGLVRTTDEAALREVNVAGTRHVADAASGLHRLVHISTAGIYGRPGGAVDEHTPPVPTSPYERSKLLAEQELARGEPTGLVILRPSNIVGVGHPLDPLLRFLTRIKCEQRIITSRAAWTNYVDVSTVAETAVAAVEHEAPSVLLVNSPLLLADLATTAADVLDRSAHLLELPSPLSTTIEPLARWLARRPGPQQRFAALFETTRMSSVHQGWFTAQGLDLTLRPVLEDMVDNYRARGLL